jgi:hypothetical protein
MTMNTPENWETFATIRAEPSPTDGASPTAGTQATQASERAAWWHEVFGGDRAPIKSIFPYRANLPGKPGALVYEMDLKALTPEMRERLVHSIARRFGQNPAFVEFDLDNVGCPILADDVVVSTTNIGLLSLADRPEALLLPDDLGDDDRLPFDDFEEELLQEEEDYLKDVPLGYYDDGDDSDDD